MRMRAVTADMRWLATAVAVTSLDIGGGYRNGPVYYDSCSGYGYGGCGVGGAVGGIISNFVY